MSVTRRKFLMTAAIAPAAMALGKTWAHAGGSAAPSVRTKSKTEAAGKVCPPASDRPNILFLWTDQHRGDILPSAGNKVIRAPNLASLASESFVFDQAYCAQPVCTPSRGSILTGLLPHNHGSINNNIPLAPERRTLAEYVPAGYDTAYYGKWHLGNELNAQHGWRDWRSIEDGMYRKHYTNSADRARRSSYHEFLVQNGFPTDDVQESEPDKPRVFSRAFAAGLAEPFTKVHYLANEAVSYLEARGHDRQPFILSVNTLEPHPPTFGPLNGAYDPATIPVGPAFAQRVTADASLLARKKAENTARTGYYSFPYSTEADLRRLRANYYGLVTMVDNAYGRILTALEAAGLADNTIVIYTSDHGDMLGDHWLMQKDVFYEQAVHIPLMIRIPWLSRVQTRLRGPVSQIDLLPTLLDLINAPAPASAALDGSSLAPALRNPSAWKPASAVVEWHDANPACNGRSLITADGWKLNLYQDDTPELYDRNTDPGELRNLGRASKHQDRIRRMSNELLDWQQRHRDPIKLTTLSQPKTTTSS